MACSNRHGSAKASPLIYIYINRVKFRLKVEFSCSNVKHLLDGCIPTKRHSSPFEEKEANHLPTKQEGLFPR